MEEKYELITLFGKPMLYSCWRVSDEEVPEGLHKYEVRYDDDQNGDMAEVSNHILVNFMGTILSKSIIENKQIGSDIYDTVSGIPIEPDDYSYDGDLLTIEEYLENYPILLDESQIETDMLTEEDEIVDDGSRLSKLSACTIACNLLSVLDSINDAEFVDEVINCVVSNDAFVLGQLASQFIGTK